MPKRKPGRGLATEPAASEQPPSGRLDSWKEIAAYFRRDIRTLHRWEKSEGLPVHRHVHSKAGTVYAIKSELDAWWKDRRLQIVGEEEKAPARVGRWKLPVVLTAFTLAAAALVWKYAIPARPLLQPSRPSSIPGRLLANATAEGRTMRMIPVGDGPEYAAATPNGSEIYVANSGSNTVSVIGTATNTVTHTIPVGGNPRVVVIPQDGKLVYVCNRFGNLSVIETATKSVSTIETEGPLSDLALAPDGRRAYIALGFRGLKELLLPSNRITTIPTMAAPMYVALAAGGSRLYINYQSSGPGGRPGHDAIDILDVASGRFLGIAGDPPNVGGPLVVSPDGRQVWAHGLNACRSPDYDHVGCKVVPGEVINVIRTSDNRFIRTLGFPQELGGAYISFFPDSSRAVIGGAKLRVIDTTTFDIVESSNLYSGGSIAFTPDGRRAYYPVSTQNAVAVFDLAAQSCLPPPPGLVAMWPADGNPNDTRGGNDGRLSGGTGFAPGHVGQAFRLDGVDGFITLGLLTSLVGGINEFTAAAWVKFSPLGTPREMTILDRMTDEKGIPDGWRLVKDPEEHVVFCIGKGTREDGCRHQGLTAVRGLKPVQPGTWLHLAAVKTPAAIALYMNGALEGYATLAKAAGPGSSEFRIGASVHGTAFLKGLVDEVQWYNRALSAAEIRSIFKADSSGLCYSGQTPQPSEPRP